MYTNIIIILRWISRYWYPGLPYETLSTLITYWTSLIQRWYKENGAITTIKRIKAIRLITTRYICGQPLMVNTDRVAVTKDGFAVCLLPFKELVDSKQPQALRFTLTCLGVSRAFNFVGDADYSSITGKSTASIKEIDPIFVKIFVDDFCGNFNPLSERPSPFKSFLSMKAGPISGPSILTAHVSASRFTGINLRGLAQIGGDRFMEWVKYLKSSIKIDEAKLASTFSKGWKLTDPRIGNRKFIQINDPEAKVRIVGCYDYISQLALTPYSEWAFDSLREIPYDRTFTQDPIILDKEESESYHSLDLSKATDRFPISLQVQFLTEVAGPAFAGAWKNLMVAEPFIAQYWVGKRSRKLIKELIKYETGQPMGARSSWATFTLCHHMVVQYAAYQNGLYPFDKYMLLGDDVVIYNDIVAKSYTDLIESLGVEISSSKSHVSKDTYEFAKRWFQNNIEISPVPISGFSSNTDNPKLLYSQLLELIYKGRGPRSLVSSIEVMTNLISRLTVPNKDQFFDSIANGGLFKQGRAYSPTQVKLSTKAFEDLQLVFRNTKEFDFNLSRSFIANATKDNDYTIPFSEESLIHEWNRASSGVVNGMAMSVVRNLSVYFNKFKESYERSVSHQFQDGVTSIGVHPLTIAVYGSVKRFHQMNKDMGYTQDLNKQLETITLFDLDKLAAQDRTSKELIFTFSTFGRKLRNQLKDDPNLYIAKAQSMRFGRALLDIQLAMAKEYPLIKAGCA